MGRAARTTDTDDGKRARRQPVQSRSVERMETILGVTAALVDEVGPDQVTTTLIAERAGMSVGSLYQYFPDKLAIFDAIVARSIEKMDASIDAARASADVRGASFIEGTGDVIDAVVGVYRTEPGFRTLWFSQYLSTAMIDSMRRSDEDNAVHGLERAHQHGLVVDRPDELAVMRIYVGIIDKGIDLVFRNSPQGDPVMLEELKFTVAVYLGAVLRPVRDGADDTTPTEHAPGRRTRSHRSPGPRRSPL